MDAERAPQLKAGVMPLANLMYQAIESVYEAFAKYRKPRDFPACECCISNEEKNLLLDRKLKVLTADELGNYAADVFLTVGSVADFKYFLPRMLELSVREEFSWPTPEVMLGKLKLADWYDWPESERAPVLRLLEEKFARLFQDANTEGQDLDPWICGLGRCVPDITPYLAPLLQEDHESKLLSFIEWNHSVFDKGKLGNGFWKDAPDNESRVVAWLTQTRVKQLLSKKYGMVF